MDQSTNTETSEVNPCPCPAGDAELGTKGTDRRRLAFRLVCPGSSAGLSSGFRAPQRPAPCSARHAYPPRKVVPTNQAHRRRRPPARRIRGTRIFFLNYLSEGTEYKTITRKENSSEPEARSVNQPTTRRLNREGRLEKKLLIDGSPKHAHWHPPRIQLSPVPPRRGPASFRHLTRAEGRKGHRDEKNLARSWMGCRVQGDRAC